MAPVSVIVGAGLPVVVTMKSNGDRITIVVELALVIAGACPAMAIADTVSSPLLVT
jgi:hypothetical protein